MKVQIKIWVQSYENMCSYVEIRVLSMQTEMSENRLQNEVVNYS